MKQLLLSFVFALSLFASKAQDITGIWRGYFVTDDGERYKLEFQIDNSTDFSKGVSYSYLDVRFYGKATMTGSYSKVGKNLKIREIKTVEVKNMTGGGACIMNYNLFYTRSGKEEFLEGTYLGKTEVKDGINPYKWGQCGGGKVFLRRVVNSDFYVEPFLKGKLKNDRPIIVNQPPRRDTVKTKPVVVKNPPVKTNPEIKNPPVVTKPVTKPPVIKDTTKTTPPVITKVNPPVVTPQPEVLKTRTNELVKVLTVTSPEVIVKLYDNGEIDDDTISVYLNNKAALSSKRLTASPLIIKLKMDDENDVQELTMVAENLGRIPPNTSLMIVEAGEQRFDVRITSTHQKNAVVRFKYQKP